MKTPVEKDRIAPEPRRGGLWPRTRSQLGLWLLGVSALVIAAGLLLRGPAQRARVIRNGVKAGAVLAKLSAAQTQYRESGQAGPNIFAYGDLTDLGRAGLIDPELASGVKDGYRFTVVPGNDGSKNTEYVWWATAEPIVPGETGDRYYFANQSGMLWYSYQVPIRPIPGAVDNRPTHGQHDCSHD